MNVFGELTRAQAELLSVDPSALIGRFFYNTTSNLLKYSTASAIKTLVDTDSTQTLSNKTAAGLTMSGTLAMANNQLTSMRVENLSSAPSAGNAGRIIFNTASGLLQFDDGLTWTILSAASASSPTLANVLGYGNSAPLASMTVGTATFTTANITTDNVTTLNVTTTLNHAGVTASRVPYFDASKNLVTSSVTDTELGYLSGVTSAIQTQINSKITAGSGAIVNADVNAAAAIARSKLASGTASHVLINDGTGVMSSEATLAITRGGTGAATATAAFDALSPTTTQGDLILRGASNNERLAIGANGSYLKSNGTTASWSTPTQPTIQFFATPGSGLTYTTPAGCVRIEVEMVGAGGEGGGGASGGPPTAGGNGGATTFSSGGVTLTANGGSGGQNGLDPAGGTGGTASIVGASGIAVAGGYGQGGTGGDAGTYATGGAGGVSFFGGAGRGYYNIAGTAAVGYGSGGAGGGAGDAAGAYGGQGGGAGGYVKAIINSPAATYTYAVGAGGTGAGAAGTNGFGGGDGFKGCIKVTEYYI